MGRFMIRRTDSGFRFDLKATNGQTVAVSEVYSSAALCRKGIASVRKCAACAKYADLTQGQAVSNPAFELFCDRAGQYRFRLKARNGKIIAVSEGYSTKAACENGVQSVRTNAADAPIEEL